MGSAFEVMLPARLPGALRLADKALDLIERLERQMTVYRDDSEISRLNAEAHLGPRPVERRLFDLISQACALSKATAGAYDITAGALSLVWGFTRGPKRVPTDDQLSLARDCTGSQHLILDPQRRTIAFDRPGIVLNLGSIGKGYAIDRAVELIQQESWLPTPALLQGGRSSLFALGSPPGRLGDRWEIALAHPCVPGRSLGSLRLRNRAMGTSGQAIQSFVVEGRSFGHLLDPRTGQPGHGPLSVSVLAPTAAQADALSTACFLLGFEGTLNYLESHPEVSVVFVRDGPTDGRCDVWAIQLDECDFEDDEAGRWTLARPRGSPST